MATVHNTNGRNINMTTKQHTEGFNITFSYAEIREACVALESRGASTTSTTRDIVYSALYKFQQWRKCLDDQSDEETKDWIRWKMVLHNPNTGSTLEEEFSCSKPPSNMDMNEFASFLCHRDYPGWTVLATELIGSDGL